MYSNVNQFGQVSKPFSDLDTALSAARNYVQAAIDNGFIDAEITVFKSGICNAYGRVYNEGGIATSI